MRNNKGFSLVELIVVIAIMAVLAAVAVIGVSIYIPKAQKAADDELLNVLTDALVAACLSEGVDPNTVNATIAVGTDGKLALKDGKVDIKNVDDDIANLFNEVFTDKGATFNQVASKTLVFRNSKFIVSDSVILGVTNGDKIYYYEADSDKADAFANSIFMTGMGIDTTLEIMDKVAGFAQAIGSGSNAFNSVLASPDFMKALVDYMGIDYDVTDATDPQKFYKDMENFGVTQEMVANAAILYSTKKSGDLTTESVKDLLGKDGAKDAILSTLQTDSATAMSQTAAAYSLYIGYLHTLPDTLENREKIQAATDDPFTVLNGLNDPGFQAYINESSDSDIDGYLAAMGMLGEAAGTSNGQGGTAAGDILTEGFDTDWMAELINQATKK